MEREERGEEERATKGGTTSKAKVEQVEQNQSFSFSLSLFFLAALAHLIYPTIMG